VASATTYRWTRGALASWWGNGSPRQRCVADLRGWSATLGLIVLSDQLLIIALVSFYLTNKLIRHRPL